MKTLLFQTRSQTGDIKQNKLYVDKDWCIYGIPTSWGVSNMVSYFVHYCSKFKEKKRHHYWVNYENQEDVLYDIKCGECATSAPQGIQALWRFHNPNTRTTLVFIEEAK